MTEEERKSMIESALRFDRACVIAAPDCKNKDLDGTPCLDCVKKALKTLAQLGQGTDLLSQSFPRKSKQFSQIA